MPKSLLDMTHDDAVAICRRIVAGEKVRDSEEACITVRFAMLPADWKARVYLILHEIVENAKKKVAAQ